jgi:hypothetical protein
MKRASFLFTMLPFLFTPPAFGGVPEINVKTLCQARLADAKILRMRPELTVAECVHDEEEKKQRLSTLWGSTSVPIRNLCQSDARALGTMSYLDLLTCIQMTEDLKLSLKEQTGNQ